MCCIALLLTSLPVADRHICWTAASYLPDTAFKIGEALGRKAAYEEWEGEHGWRVKMSGGGVAVLSFFLFSVGLVAGTN
jgi:hypothetical protein